jgi:hypothetical protein
MHSEVFGGTLGCNQQFWYVFVSKLTCILKSVVVARNVIAMKNNWFGVPRSSFQALHEALL